MSIFNGKIVSKVCSVFEVRQNEGVFYKMVKRVPKKRKITKKLTQYLKGV